MDLTEDTPCPEGIQEVIFSALKRYIFHHIVPGGYLRSVLENNLHEASSRGDSVSWDGVRVLVSYIYWQLPGQSWGSREKVDEWVNSKEHSIHLQ